MCLGLPDERSSTLKNEPRHCNSILDYPSFTEKRSDVSMCVASEMSSVSVNIFLGGRRKVVARKPITRTESKIVRIFYQLGMISRKSVGQDSTMPSLMKRYEVLSAVKRNISQCSGVRFRTLR